MRVSTLALAVILASPSGFSWAQTASEGEKASVEVGEDYRISFAVDYASEDQKLVRFKRFTLDDMKGLIEREPEYHYPTIDFHRSEPVKVDWLVDGLIGKGDRAIIIGDPGAGKSWLAMALSVSTLTDAATFSRDSGRFPAVTTTPGM